VNPSPSPAPIPVTVVAAPAELWQVIGALSPFAVLAAAIIAAIVGFRQIKQKREADNRAEWWKRTQWALDAAYSGDDRRRAIGLKVLTVLAGSDLAGSGELDVLEAASEDPLDEAARDIKATVEGIGSEEGFGHPTVIMGPPPFSQAVIDLWRKAESAYSSEPRVDGEAGPRDNEEDDQQDTTEGGAR
jgi:hypothetical protein